jgi:hypothetical protein
MCPDILQNIENNPNLSDNVVTSDELRFFQYGQESKHQSLHWKSPSSPRQNKSQQSKSKFKAMKIIFVDMRDCSHGLDVCRPEPYRKEVST